MSSPWDRIRTSHKAAGGESRAASTTSPNIRHIHSTHLGLHLGDNVQVRIKARYTLQTASQALTDRTALSPSLEAHNRPEPTPAGCTDQELETSSPTTLLRNKRMQRAELKS